MPYTKKHKAKTRELILASAQSLFSQRGFDSVSVNEVMSNCSLTRGAFYAHFSSKSELYAEALRFSVRYSRLTQEKPNYLSNREWLDKLVNGYLSLEHVRGERPCPLAFLSKDIVARDKSTKEAYGKAYEGMNDVILSYLEPEAGFDKQSIYALTSMSIGAVSISRTLDNTAMVKKILSSSRDQVRLILEAC